MRPNVFVLTGNFAAPKRLRDGYKLLGRFAGGTSVWGVVARPAPAIATFTTGFSHAETPMLQATSRWMVSSEAEVDIYAWRAGTYLARFQVGSYGHPRVIRIEGQNDFRARRGVLDAHGDRSSSATTRAFVHQAQRAAGAGAGSRRAQRDRLHVQLALPPDARLADDCARGLSEMTLACPRCKAPLDGRLACSNCGAAYQAVDGVPILLSEELTEQHLHQREYFDAEFAGYEEYEVENWRLSYIERIFGALGVLDGQGPYLDVGVGGSGRHGDRSCTRRRGGRRLRSLRRGRSGGSPVRREREGDQDFRIVCVESQRMIEVRLRLPRGHSHVVFEVRAWS